MEDSYEFDHHDYQGQPLHLSTSITFTIKDKGAEITLAKANTEEYLELPKESFASFNKHFDQPEDLPILFTAYTIHKANRGAEVREALENLGTKEFGWVGDDGLGGLEEISDYEGAPIKKDASGIPRFSLFRSGEAFVIQRAKTSRWFRSRAICRRRRIPHRTR